MIISIIGMLIGALVTGFTELSAESAVLFSLECLSS